MELGRIIGAVSTNIILSIYPLVIKITLTTYSLINFKQIGESIEVITIIRKNSSLHNHT